MAASDVIVIGGGVIGLSIARELSRDSSVTLFERGTCGMEASHAAAGMLGAQTEAHADDAFFRLLVRSRGLFPDLAEELLDETGIDIELDRAGSFLISFTAEGLNARIERSKWQKAAGFPVEQLSAAEIRREEPFVSTDVLGGIFLPDDGQVDNRKLVEALRRSCEARGVRIFENAAVDRLDTIGARVTGIFANGERFAADNVVLAAGSWSTSLANSLDIPFVIKPIRGQILLYRTAKRLFKHVIVGRRGYIVPRSDGRVLSGATMEDAGFDPSLTNEATELLIQSTREISPNLASLRPADAWTGFRPFAPDGLPILGPMQNVEGLFLALGHFRNGILLSPVTAKLIAADIHRDSALGTPKEFTAARFFREDASESGLRAAMQRGERKQ